MQLLPVLVMCDYKLELYLFVCFWRRRTVAVSDDGVSSDVGQNDYHWHRHHHQHRHYHHSRWHYHHSPGHYHHSRGQYCHSRDNISARVSVHGLLQRSPMCCQRHGQLWVVCWLSRRFHWKRLRHRYFGLVSINHLHQRVISFNNSV